MFPKQQTYLRGNDNEIKGMTKETGCNTKRVSRYDARKLRHKAFPFFMSTSRAMKSEKDLYFRQINRTLVRLKECKITRLALILLGCF